MAKMGAATATSMDEVYGALGNGVRLDMVRQIAARGESCACELADLMGLSTTTLSYHIGRLRGAGLVSEERRGRWRVLRVDMDAVARYAPPLWEELAGLRPGDLPPLEERVGCPAPAVRSGAPDPT
jgi:ArsR family transcriptional regulator